MNRATQGSSRKNSKTESGMTFIETMVALGMLLVVAAGIMGLSAIALSTTETQGHLASRTAEYAQDKMEQLLALRFCDSTTDTTVFPPGNNGNGLAGCTNQNAVVPTPSAGGGLSIAAPTKGYVDYVDASGTSVAAGASWEYIRVWQISVPAGTTGFKQISVTCQARNGAGTGQPPQSTIVAMKSFPF